MTDADESTDWRKLREFACVDLTQSFILSCAVESETLVIEIDLFLTPEHPFYEKPRPAQRACIRPAVIEFPYCESIAVDGVALDAGFADVTDRIGHGAIDGLCRHAGGGYEISGEFGKLLVDAERPILRLKNP